MRLQKYYQLEYFLKCTLLLDFRRIFFLCQFPCYVRFDEAGEEENSIKQAMHKLSGSFPDKNISHVLAWCIQSKVCIIIRTNDMTLSKLLVISA